MDDKTVLLTASVIRIILTYLILHYTDFQLHVKIILIIVIDMLDCGLLRLLNMYNNTDFCTTYSYQSSDKITDSVSYILILLYIYKNKSLPMTEINLVTALLAYRLIGISIFLSNGRGSTLFYFPNFYLETALALSFIKDTGLLTKRVLPFVFVYKVLQERYMHYNKVYT